MKSHHFIILDKHLFQQQLLIFFQEIKNIAFLNSNDDEKVNLLAISDSDKVVNGGWQFGFVSYDYKNQIEQLSSNNFDGINFPKKHFFTPEILFEISNDKVVVAYNSVLYKKEELIDLLNKVKKIPLTLKKNKQIKIKSRETKKQYVEKIKKLKQHIQIGDIYEINYCQEFYAENVNINPIELYFKLNKKSPAPFSCFVKCDDKYLISASPERYLQKKGTKIISQPIKGTIKRGTSLQEDELLKKALFNDKKEQAENVMIVDLVRNDLSKIAQKNTVKVEELCGIYTYPQVHQMISTISAEVQNNITFNDIIKATFPMGSMTGAPKIRAMELIEKYEKNKRGLYSGTVGYINPINDFDFNVVIRSILYNPQNNYLSFMVGGAITNQSIPEKEYEECLLKAKAILEVLNR